MAYRRKGCRSIDAMHRRCRRGGGGAPSGACGGSQRLKLDLIRKGSLRVEWVGPLVSRKFVAVDLRLSRRAITHSVHNWQTPVVVKWFRDITDRLNTPGSASIPGIRVVAGQLPSRHQPIRQGVTPDREVRACACGSSCFLVQRPCVVVRVASVAFGIPPTQTNPAGADDLLLSGSRRDRP